MDLLVCLEFQEQGVEGAKEVERPQRVEVEYGWKGKTEDEEVCGSLG